jgi:hypothetical protein
LNQDKDAKKTKPYRTTEDTRHDNWSEDQEVLLRCFARVANTHTTTTPLATVNEEEMVAAYRKTGYIEEMFRETFQDALTDAFRRMAFAMFRDGWGHGQAEVGTDSYGETLGEPKERDNVQDAQEQTLFLPHKREVAAKNFDWDYRDRDWFISCRGERHDDQDVLIVLIKKKELDGAPSTYEFEGTTYPVLYED